MDSRELKEIAYHEISLMVKSLSNPHRLEIIDLLANGEKSVESIAKESEMTIANASQHLQTLKQSKWVQTRREKNFIFYSLKSQYTYAIWKTMREFARLQLPEINAALADYRKPNAAKYIKHAELETYAPYMLVDARPGTEYDSGHLENAVSIYSKDDIPTNTNLVVYSRGAFCTLADEAIAELNRDGFTALRLDEGYRDLV
jgi:DNA-binding transcriptional ArsR family regulator